jgi:hypothetical protein
MIKAKYSFVGLGFRSYGKRNNFLAILIWIYIEILSLFVSGHFIQSQFQVTNGQGCDRKYKWTTGKSTEMSSKKFAQRGCSED